MIGECLSKLQPDYTQKLVRYYKLLILIYKLDFSGFKNGETPMLVASGFRIF